MNTTDIEWTEVTWNPTTGCDRVSDGCTNCYALTMAKRLKGMEAARIAAGKLDPARAKYQTDGHLLTSGPGFGVAVHLHTLDEPLALKTPTRIFVNSMSDLFHDHVPDTFLAAVFAVMAATPRHTYQVLTKRHARMRSALNSPEFFDAMLDVLAGFPEGERAIAEQRVPWPLPNVWLGVSVESQQWADIRIPALLDTPAAVRWLSCEPLLGPLDLFGPIVRGHRPRLTYWLTGRPGWGPEQVGPTGLVTQEPVTGPKIDWVVVGGETGKNARPMHPAWVEDLRDQCVVSEVPFFLKQWGDWAPERVCATERGAESALYIEHDGSTRPAAVGARGAAVTVQRNGKHLTGRLLDGKEWTEYPPCRE